MDDKLSQQHDTNLKDAKKVAKDTSVLKTFYVALTPNEIKGIRASVNMSD